MKKLLLVCCLFTPTLAMAQNTPPPAGNEAGHGPEDGQRFEQAKAHMTQRLQEMLNCVQAAQDIEALKACRPKHPEGEHGGPGGERGDGQAGGPPSGASNAWTHPQNTPSP